MLRRHLSDKQYFEIGRKRDESGGLAFIRRMLTDYWQFHRILSRGNFSLVHLNPSLGPKALLRDVVFLLIARAHAIPVLVLFHGWNNKFQALIQRRFCWLFRSVFNRTEAIIVLAADFRRQLEAMGITARIHLGTTCVDDGFFEREPERSDSRLNILYLSRLAPGKGVIEAIRAFSKLDDATMTIAGDGPEREAAENLVADEAIANVRFLGHVEGEAKRRAYSEANVYLFTSVSEGMPTTVLEAMAHGLPVVTRSVGGIKDFFENGRMGFTTESRDAADFAELLECITPELAEQMGEHNRRYAREHFAASVVAKKLESFYEQAMVADELYDTATTQ